MCVKIGKIVYKITICIILIIFCDQITEGEKLEGGFYIYIYMAISGDIVKGKRRWS